MRMNADSIICDRSKEFKLKSFSEYYIKFCSYDNRHMGVKFVLKNKKIQDISKMTRRYYRLQKDKVINTWISRKNILVSRRILKSSFDFSL